MPFHLRFYVYDDVEHNSSHYLLADIHTSSLVGFSTGNDILLIEHNKRSLAKSYVIAREPMVIRHPRGLSESVQYVDVFVVKEESWPEVTPPVL